MAKYKGLILEGRGGYAHYVIVVYRGFSIPSNIDESLEKLGIKHNYSTHGKGLVKRAGDTILQEYRGNFDLTEKNSKFGEKIKNIAHSHNLKLDNKIFSESLGIGLEKAIDRALMKLSIG